MAAVTINSQRDNINGSYRERFYNITGATGGTLATDLHIIKSVTFNDTTISLASVSGGTITFTAGGAITNELVRVLGL